MNPNTIPAERIFLPSHIFFGKVGDEVYVRNVLSDEEFLFNGEAAPIFSALKRGAKRSGASLRKHGDFLRLLESLGLTARERGIKAKRTEEKARLAKNSFLTDEDLAAHMQDVSRSKRRLWSACLELTYRCNAKCRHCYLDDPAEQVLAEELSKDEWFSVVDQLKSLGCMNILVTGGEPTLHPVFFDVCRYVLEKGMLCDVYTNGMDIPKEICASLLTLPLNSVSFSLYSGSPAFHDQITGIPGSFRKTLDTLLCFQNAGLETYAKCTLFHGHLEEYFSAKTLGNNLGFAVKPANIIVPGHSGTRQDELMLDDAEYREFLERDIHPESGIDTQERRVGRANANVCQAGLSTLCISPFGIVRPCNSFQLDCGNVRNSSLSQIWRNSPTLKLVRQLRMKDFSEHCAICPNIMFCSICPGASWSESKTFAPCSWSCGQASVRANFNRKN